MSGYVESVASARGAARSGVGEQLSAMGVTSARHPAYEAYTRVAEAHFNRKLAKATEQRARSQQAVVSVTVESGSKHAIASEYPEFRIIWPKFGERVHATWLARRQLINQLMTHYSRKYATSWVHYGGAALSYATAGIYDVHLEVVTNNVVAMQENASDLVDLSALMSSPHSAAVESEWYLASDARAQYAANAWTKCQRGHKCLHKGDALIVDGSLYALSPGQFMFAMQQHGAAIGYMSLPYDSNMLIKSEGELASTGVYYEMRSDRVKFIYPEGTSGVTSYAAAAWHQWLLNIEREHAQLDSNYMFEIMSERAGYMVIRVVSTDKRDVPHRLVKHSLQLAGMRDMVAVRAWRLNDLAADPNSRSSWHLVTELVPAKIVEKVFEFAMALPAEDFSRTNLRKRIENVNTRVVVNGTMVTVKPPMSAAQVSVVEMAIFIRAFIMRYEANTLSQHMMTFLKEYARFGEMSNMRRCATLIGAMASKAYDLSIGVINNALRAAFDNARDWFTRGKVPFDTHFDPAPQFINFATVMGGGAAPYLAVMDVLSDVSVSALSAVVGVAGYAQTMLLGVRGHVVDVPLVSLDAAQYEQRTGEVYSDLVDTSLEGEASASGQALRNHLRASNFMDQDDGTRHVMTRFSYAANVGRDMDVVSYSFDPAYIETMNSLHEAAFPGMSSVDYTMDFASIALDDQHRHLAADNLQVPLEPGPLPASASVYVSKLTAYRTLKRRNTPQETLTALQARNLAAPVVAIPQNDELLIYDIWQKFLDNMCVPDAREKLAQYASDPVALEQKAVDDWTKKANPATVDKVVKYLVDNPTAWEEMRLYEYDMMVKPDVKPPLSDKPMHTYIPPQVIVYHKPYINAIFSSIFRILVRRFEALLLPHVFVNWLKDTDYIRDFIQNNHPWGCDTLHYLENDFSKYDKSQAEFVHKLEAYVFEQLGMNDEMLKAWQFGHVDCKLRSVTTGVSLWVRYQRKSGDATTSFGNGLVNLLSVNYVYRGTDIAWAVFIGDDSLVCARKVVGAETAVQALEEQFNLLAKYFITNEPYFASCFYIMDDRQKSVTAVPDPFKRVEKWSVAIPANDPKWSERYQSAVDSCKVYRNRMNLVGLEQLIYKRYNIREHNVQGVGDAIASALRDENSFRAMWESEPSKLLV